MDTPQADITVDTIRGWAEALTEVDQRIGSLFARAEARHRALAYLQGLLSPAQRKNSWQLAEMVGIRRPLASSTCSGGRTGMRMHCGMPCTATSSSTSARTTRSGD